MEQCASTYVCATYLTGAFDRGFSFTHCSASSKVSKPYCAHLHVPKVQAAIGNKYARVWGDLTAMTEPPV